MFNQKPSAGNCRGFFVNQQQHPEQNVLAQKQQLLVRYYLWAADGPWRLPSRLHYDLMDRKVALPQYAGTKQKVLEVFARRIGVDTYSFEGRALSLRAKDVDWPGCCNSPTYSRGRLVPAKSVMICASLTHAYVTIVFGSAWDALRQLGHKRSVFSFMSFSPRPLSRVPHRYRR